MTIDISGYSVLIDDEDWEKVHKYKWGINAPQGLTKSIMHSMTFTLRVFIMLFLCIE